MSTEEDPEIQAETIKEAAEKTPLLEASPDTSSDTGSGVGGAIFNFTNSIIGAGAIGLGSAIAQSGGLATIVSLIFIGVLTRESFDLVITLAVEAEGAGGSYENLGRVAYGRPGRMAVIVSKIVFSFGCLVVYTTIVKDNLGSAARSLIAKAEGPSFGGFHGLASSDAFITAVASAVVMLPLSFLRDVFFVEQASIFKLLVVVGISMSLLYLYIANPGGEVRQPYTSFTKDWLQVHPELISNLGTLVFTFAAAHTLHITFNSMKPSVRDVHHWKQVSFYSVLLSGVFTLLIGITAYVTFWSKTSSNLFVLYPHVVMVDVTKLLLAIMIMLTYPLSFMTCRELVVVSLPNSYMTPEEEEQGNEKEYVKPWWLLREKQLIRWLHVTVTLIIWASSTTLAVLAPSLGSVLNFVGCAAGTPMAFILPALFAFKLRGPSFWSILVLGFGGSVGLWGTYLSLVALV